MRARRATSTWMSLTDAYELSFVAVPAQRAAGVVKHYGGRGEPEALPQPGEEAPELTLRMRLTAASLALAEMEEIRRRTRK